MILLALGLAAAEPLVPTARAFDPPVGPVRYRVTQVRRLPGGQLRAALTETLRFEPDGEGFRATLVSGEPAVEGPPALIPSLRSALGTFAQIAVTYRLDRSGHPTGVVDAGPVWAAMLAGIDAQVRTAPQRSPILDALRRSLLAESPAEREAMLLDMADTLLGFVPDALTPGQALPYSDDAVGAGTIRRGGDEDGAVRYTIDTAGGRSPAHEHVEVAIDPDGLLRWLRRTTGADGAGGPDQAMLVERLKSSGN